MKNKFVQFIFVKWPTTSSDAAEINAMLTKLTSRINKKSYFWSLERTFVIFYN